MYLVGQGVSSPKSKKSDGPRPGLGASAASAYLVRDLRHVDRLAFSMGPMGPKVTPRYGEESDNQ